MRRCLFPILVVLTTHASFAIKPEEKAGHD